MRGERERDEEARKVEERDERACRCRDYDFHRKRKERSAPSWLAPLQKHGNFRLSEIIQTKKELMSISIYNFNFNYFFCLTCDLFTL